MLIAMKVVLLKNSVHPGPRPKLFSICLLSEMNCPLIDNIDKITYIRWGIDMMFYYY